MGGRGKWDLEGSGGGEGGVGGSNVEFKTNFREGNCITRTK